MSVLRAARLSERVVVTGGSVDGRNYRDEVTLRFLDALASLDLKLSVTE
jgi:predicted aconitase